MKISDYEFEGPFTTTDELMNKSGVYVIHCKNSQGTYDRIDVGESKDVKERIENHKRKECWEENCKNTITYSAYYTNEDERMKIEKKLRSERDLPCGDK